MDSREIGMGEQQLISWIAGEEVDDSAGSPASRKTRMTKWGKNAVEAGFQRIVLPMRAGDAERIPPMAVKLKG